MTTFRQFSEKARMRHDYSDQIQVRYSHPNGEDFDTWISGEEVMLRLNTQDRERLIKSIGRLDLREVRDEAGKAIRKGKERAARELRDRLAETASDLAGDNIFGDTLADKIRGEGGDVHPHDREKQLWQSRLRDDSFRAVAIELAWINLEGTFPDEREDEPDDWI